VSLFILSPKVPGVVGFKAFAKKSRIYVLSFVWQFVLDLLLVFFLWKRRCSPRCFQGLREEVHSFSVKNFVLERRRFSLFLRFGVRDPPRDVFKLKKKIAFFSRSLPNIMLQEMIVNGTSQA
jgi:hypothetical protein